MGLRYPVTMRKASLIDLLMRRVWGLRHQTDEQYSAASKSAPGQSGCAQCCGVVNCLKIPTLVVNFFAQ